MSDLVTSLKLLVPQAIDFWSSKIVDAKSVPYLSTDEANRIIPPEVRHGIRLIFIDDGTGTIIHWYKDGLADNNLVPYKPLLEVADIPDLDDYIIQNNAAYGGPATPATNPGTPLAPIFYTASTAGTYTNFKDVTNTSIVLGVNDGLVNLSYNGTYWTKQAALLDLSAYAFKKQSDFNEKAVKGTGYVDITQSAYSIAKITPETGTVWSSGSGEFANSIVVYYKAISTKTFNQVRIPLVRNYTAIAGIPTTYTDSITVKIWVAGVLVKTQVITLAELAYYNALTAANVQGDFYYNVLLDSTVRVDLNDLIVVGWQCNASTDRTAHVYKVTPATTGEWILKRWLNVSILANDIAPAEPGTTQNYNIILFFNLVRNSVSDPSVLKDQAYEKRLRGIALADNLTPTVLPRINPVVSSIWNSGSSQMAHGWMVFYKGITEKNINQFSFPIVRNFAGNPVDVSTTFTDGITAKLWLNGVLVHTENITLAQLATYNTLVLSSGPNAFYYTCNLNAPVAIGVNDQIVVGWECKAATDKCAITYRIIATDGFATEYGGNSFAKSDTVGFVSSVNAVPQATFPAAAGFYIGIFFNYKSYLDQLVGVVKDPLLTQKLRAFAMGDGGTTFTIYPRINAPATSRWISGAGQWKKAWKVYYKALTEKNINQFGFPMVRNYTNNPNTISTTFTDGFTAKMWVNGGLIKTKDISLADISAYNLMDAGTPVTGFYYYVDLDVPLAVEPNDIICVGWECKAATDKCTHTYRVNTADGFATEWGDNRFESSDTAGYISGSTAAPATTLPAAGSFYIGLQFNWKSFLNQVTKASLTPISPARIFVVCNDVLPNASGTRNYAAAFYIDHLFDLQTRLKLYWKETGSDKAPFLAPISLDGLTYNAGQNVNKVNKTFTVTGDASDISVTVQQVSTKASVGATVMPRIMQIGDSVTNGFLANVGAGVNAPWKSYEYAHTFFEMDRIDAGNPASNHLALFLGTTSFRSYIVPYTGNPVIKSYAEGRGGWRASDYVYKADERTPSQGVYDLLGLGNGTGTDYTGSAAQLQAIATTAEGLNTPLNTANFISYMQNKYPSAGITDYATAAAKAADLLDNPVNPFFDKTKSGSDRFSYGTYLSRYKTLDNDGVTRLVVGATAGTKVTNSNSWDVCTPTHVVIQLGFNDGNVSWLIPAIQIMIANIQAVVGGVNIILSLPDAAGTYFPELYPEISTSASLYNNTLHSAMYAVVQNLKALENEASKIFYMPSFFVQPTALGNAFRTVNYAEFLGTGDPKNKYSEEYGSGPEYHSNTNAHAAWGYQLYALIKYTLSL